MEVQTQEDDLVHLNNMVIKRRRTKRPRPSSPLALTMATSSSSTVELAMDGHVANSSSSPSDSGTDHEFVKSTEEEEDMANCLILLAQGHNKQNFSPSPEFSFLSGYQCKTCNRCFPSFQALGGHRASHKKTKPNTILEDIKKPMDLQEVENCLNLNKDVTTLSLQIPSRVSSFCPNGNNNTTLSLQIPSRVSSSGPNSNNNIGKNKNRVHECSICGAEFSSGQALGGHMRRHRPLPTSIAIASNSHEESHETKNSTRNFLSLDLNLPAPEDDHRETKFSFASKEQVIVFSASPLVDCHY